MELIFIIETEMTLSAEEAKNLDDWNFILLFKEVRHFWNAGPQKICIWHDGTVQTSNSFWSRCSSKTILE